MSHPHFTRVAATEGYTAHRSFRPGDRVEVHASSRSPTVGVRVRHAVSGVVVGEIGEVAIDEHPVPDRAWEVGCDWPVAFDTWDAGLYLVDFVERSDGLGEPTSPAWFAVGDPPGSARPLLVLSTNTWNAYNQWGGRCMYSGASELSFRRPLEHGYLERPTDADGFDGRIAAVDLDPEHHRLIDYQRAHGLPLWTSSSGWFNWERRFQRWAASEGFGFDVALDIDLHRDGSLLGDRPLVVVVGHSEYWSWEMRDGLDAFVAAGGNLAILSGNTGFWQVRITEDDTMICHKGNARFDDPVRGSADERRLTSMWSDPLIDRPENLTTGLSFTRGGYHRIGQGTPRGSGGYEVHRADHWALAGTGLRYGDVLGGRAAVVGYEVDGCALALRDGLPIPTGEDGTPTDLDIIASAPARLLSIDGDICEPPAALWASLDPPGDLQGVAWVLFGDTSPASLARVAHGRCVMGCFERGGSVFNVGSADWAHGLDDDPVVQQITRNVLKRFGA